MQNLTIKQKIILGIIIGIMAVTIGTYGFITLNSNDETNEFDNILDNNELIQQESNPMRKRYTKRNK